MHKKTKQKRLTNCTHCTKTAHKNGNKKITKNLQKNFKRDNLYHSIVIELTREALLIVHFAQTGRVFLGLFCA